MDNLRDAIFQALGQVSMCWSERPRGVFQDEQATEIGERLLEAIQQHEQAAIARERSAWLLSHPHIIRDAQGQEIARTKALKDKVE